LFPLFLLKIVFIHRSNKTRIETDLTAEELLEVKEFLYIDPIKQGLKLRSPFAISAILARFYT